MDFLLELLFASLATVVIPVYFLHKLQPDNRYLNSAKAVGPNYWGSYEQSGEWDGEETFELKAPPPLKDVVLGSRSYVQGKGVRQYRNYSMR